jgi:hypothetical protein
MLRFGYIEKFDLTVGISWAVNLDADRQYGRWSFFGLLQGVTTFSANKTRG